MLELLVDRTGCDEANDDEIVRCFCCGCGDARVVDAGCGRSLRVVESGWRVVGAVEEGVRKKSDLRKGDWGRDGRVVDGEWAGWPRGGSRTSEGGRVPVLGLGRCEGRGGS